ncbi:hypothetical protein HPB50_008205 [Hyalomma asiaticum]|uniref:Uncharacterized protein n=1 Tax=Hyalomma asiaticum TaxID=266040 RepID=A0ACB7SD40_HYAAI|nr:hypothetical protein HPB50_008205 [Hyalomma asiaticum]
MAAQVPVAGALVLRAGFKDIVVGSFFRDATIKKGENLHESGHVFDVSERFDTAASVLTAKCVRQACVTQEAYSIAIEERHTSSLHLPSLKIGNIHALRGRGLPTRRMCRCKHAAAVVTYVNKEDTSTKTSVENVWKRPSAKQLGMYNKGKLARQPVPTGIIDSNCLLGIMLHQEQEIAENLADLDKVLRRLGQPSNISGAESIPVEEVVVTEEERNDIAKQTILQSGCPQWHCARALRISASSKAHRIKIRQADFESLAQQLVTPRSFKSAAVHMAYQMNQLHEKNTSPKRAASPDGLIDEEEGIRLLKIKAPYRCESRPVVDHDINCRLSPLQLEKSCNYEKVTPTTHRFK